MRIVKGQGKKIQVAKRAVFIQTAIHLYMHFAAIKEI